LRRLTYSIKIKTNKLTKSFFYQGEEGKMFEHDYDIKDLRYGLININEICEFILSPVSKENLLKISKESDIYYLRETAKRMLQK